MKYTVSVMFQDGSGKTWNVSDRSVAVFILTTEMKIAGKQIKKASLKGVRV